MTEPRRYLIALLALWLPIANAWALLTPCAHAAFGSESAAAADAAMPCHGGTDQPSPANASDDAACANCAHCHLSGTPLLPSVEPLVAARAHAVEHAHSPPARISFIPRLALPPPVA